MYYSDRTVGSPPELQGVRGAQPPGNAGGPGGAAPRKSRGVWGAAGPPIRERYDSSKVQKYNSLSGHKIFRNNLGDSCANLAEIQETPFSYM